MIKLLQRKLVSDMNDNVHFHHDYIVYSNKPVAQQKLETPNLGTQTRLHPRIIDVEEAGVTLHVAVRTRKLKTTPKHSKTSATSHMMF